MAHSIFSKMSTAHYALTNDNDSAQICSNSHREGWQHLLRREFGHWLIVFACCHSLKDFGIIKDYLANPLQVIVGHAAKRSIHQISRHQSPAFRCPCQRLWASNSFATDSALRKPSSATLASFSALCNVWRWKSSCKPAGPWRQSCSLIIHVDSVSFHWKPNLKQTKTTFQHLKTKLWHKALFEQFPYKTPGYQNFISPHPPASPTMALAARKPSKDLRSAKRGCASSGHPMSPRPTQLETTICIGLVLVYHKYT